MVGRDDWSMELSLSVDLSLCKTRMVGIDRLKQSKSRINTIGPAKLGLGAAKPIAELSIGEDSRNETSQHAAQLASSSILIEFKVGLGKF